MYEKFEKLLKEKNLTAYKVSKDTGISQSTLSDWKSGRSVPKTDKLKTLSDYLGVSIDYFIPKVIKTQTAEGDSEGFTIEVPQFCRNEQERKLLNYFSLLSRDMQDSFLAMLESTARNIQQQPETQHLTDEKPQ